MRALVFLSVLSLTACVAGPNFEPPKAPATERFTSEELPNIELATRAADAGATPGQEWWTAFHSPKLDETVQMALAGNRRLKSAQATLQQARELYYASRGARLPDAEATAMNARNKYGAAFLGGFQLPPFTAYSVGANVNYLLDFAGGVRRTIEEQQALAEVREHEATAAHLSLTGNVVLEALRIASAQARIRAAESIIDEDSRNVELVRKALDEGSVARVDLLTAQSQLAQDQTLLPPLRQELSAARHALAVLVGQPPGNWSPPDFELEDFTALSPLPVSLPSELARRRPDIRASEAQLHAATAAVGVAAANLYPKITLTGSLSQQALKASDLFDQSAFAFGLSGNLTAPLFNGGKLRAERRAAEAARQAAVANYEETVLTAFRQVADVLAALEHDTQLVTAQQQALDVAENNLRLTRESYSAGNVGVLQILEAERAVQSARIGVASATAQRLQDTAELIVALGGDSPLAPTAATAGVR
ncbi:MAG TPA: efflux transporter outer membrane subunit [Steroidobacteraceae bacterium]|jgi:NodT family efflux transporter outer membrane factor (OMF) lipoprotein|nr:efflux transporter outer membrane subunit [Steroidobacteraceae bacterium]